jgi:hypothetical protein
MFVAAPLASYIPLAAVLAVVAWNMAEKHEFAALLRASRGDAVVLLATFLLVVFRDLTEGILVGFGIGALLFLHRMAQAVEVESARPWRTRPTPPTASPATSGSPPTPEWWSAASPARSSSARRRRSRPRSTAWASTPGPLSSTSRPSRSSPRRPPRMGFRSTVADAVAAAHRKAGLPEAAPQPAQG